MGLPSWAPFVFDVPQAGRTWEAGCPEEVDLPSPRKRQEAESGVRMRPCGSFSDSGWSRAAAQDLRCVRDPSGAVAAGEASSLQL